MDPFWYKKEALKYQSELSLVDIAKFIPEDPKKLKLIKYFIWLYSALKNSFVLCSHSYAYAA